jgi:hypothetical protein
MQKPVTRGGGGGRRSRVALLMAAPVAILGLFNIVTTTARLRPPMVYGRDFNQDYLFALLAVGPESMARYFLYVPAVVRAEYEGVWVNMSLSSVGWRLFGGVWSWGRFPSMEPLVHAPELVLPTSVALSMAALAGSLLLVRRGCSPATAVSLMICVSILVSPISWTHHLILLLVPVFLIVDRLARQGWPRGHTAAGAFALLLTVPIYDGSGLIAGMSHAWPLPFAYSLIGLLPTLATGLVSWLVLASDARHR